LTPEKGDLPELVFREFVITKKTICRRFKWANVCSGLCWSVPYNEWVSACVRARARASEGGRVCCLTPSHWVLLLITWTSLVSSNFYYSLLFQWILLQCLFLIKYLFCCLLRTLNCIIYLGLWRLCHFDRFWVFPCRF
jgi:hypothetical protein